LDFDVVALARRVLLLLAEQPFHAAQLRFSHELLIQIFEHVARSLLPLLHMGGQFVFLVEHTSDLLDGLLAEEGRLAADASDLLFDLVSYGLLALDLQIKFVLVCFVGF